MRHSALTQDIWKGESYASINLCQQTKGGKQREVN